MRKIILSLILVTLLMMVGVSAVTDLAITGVQLTNSLPSASSLSLDINITNLGDTSITLSNMKLKFLLSVDNVYDINSDQSSGETLLGSTILNPGVTITKNVITYPFSASYSYLVMKADASDILVESNENNNYGFYYYGGLTCLDKVKNNYETDIDCGGDICPKCMNDKGCSLNNDCESNYCNAGICKTAPEPKSYLWLYILLILVIAVLITLVYKNKKKKCKTIKGKKVCRRKR